MPSIASRTIQHGLHAFGPDEAKYPGLWENFVGGPCPALLGAGGQFCPTPRPIRPSLTSAAVQAWFQSPIGPAFGSGGTAAGLSWPATTGIGNVWKFSPPLTYFAYLYWDGAFDVFVWTTDSRTVAIPVTNGLYRGMMMWISSGSRDVALVAADSTSNAGPGGAGTQFVGSSSAGVPVNEWFTVMMTATGQPLSTSNVRIWLNGTEETAMASGGAGISAVHNQTANTLHNGTRNTGLQTVTGLRLAEFLCWNRVLKDSEIAMLHADPLAPWRHWETEEE